MALDKKLNDIARKAAKARHKGKYLEAMRLSSQAYVIQFDKMGNLDTQIRAAFRKRSRMDDKSSDEQARRDVEYWNSEITHLMRERDQLYGSFLTFQEHIQEERNKLLAQYEYKFPSVKW